jgi:o-succinylbenzoate synthase
MSFLNLIHQLPATTQVYAQPYTLFFKNPSGTSRGILTQKKIWLLKSHQTNAIGECAPLEKLSIDDFDDYNEKIAEICKVFNSRNVDKWTTLLQTMPSAAFGFETFLLDAINGGKQIIFPSKFTQQNIPITINGLVWMGDEATMQQQITEKIEQGFGCIKLKIGAIDFDAEINLIKKIRQKFGAQIIEIRVDANGAFAPNEAQQKIEMLSKYKLHSIEQPIQQHQPENMRQLCATTPLPIALDEELINPTFTKTALLDFIKPQYIVIKPTLVGGLAQTQEWITIAQKQNIGWWLTSALESNVGLNAIAQFAYTLQSTMPQGLGTGQLFTNNFDDNFSLTVQNGKLYYQKPI